MRRGCEMPSSREGRRQPNIPQWSCLRKDAANPQGAAGAPSSSSARSMERPCGRSGGVMELIIEPANAKAALKRVERNRGGQLVLMAWRRRTSARILGSAGPRSGGRCFVGRISRRQYAGTKSRSQAEARGCWGYPQRWTGSSSEPSCKCSRRASARSSPVQAVGSGPGEARARQ